MTEYVNVRASETLDQGELVAFLKSRFGQRTKSVGRHIIKGTECVEVRVRSNSPEFDEISQFIGARRAQGAEGFSKLPIGWCLRKYTEQELRRAEILRLRIHSHFEPCGEECGTIYETLCNHCNWGRQLSDLALDLRRIPQHKDIHESIALVEWVVSSKFVQLFIENRLTGAEFKPILNFKNPTKRSDEWYQLKITGKIGKLAEMTKLGSDPFSDAAIDWRCPLGHSVVAQLLSETFLHRDTWDKSDIALTNDLFGQGRNLVRPRPLIIISQRLFRLMDEAVLKGFSCEVAHLV
jgi:hypothetical protein